jgi:K+-transporting ATPase ATPase C chain
VTRTEEAQATPRSLRSWLMKGVREEHQAHLAPHPSPHQTGGAVECAPFGQDCSQGVITLSGEPRRPCLSSQPTPSRLAGADSTPTSTPRALQLARVAKARGMSIAALDAVVDAHTSSRFLVFLGELTVNVLALNLDLHRRYPYRP